MDSFDELNLSPALVEALAAEGIEHPTALQRAAIPVLTRGNHLVARAGPGAGVTVAVGAPLLDRLEPGTGGPVAVIVAPTPARARELADRIGQLAPATSHRIAALDGRWALPERASVLVVTPEQAARRLRQSRLDLTHVGALVVDGAATLAADDEAWQTVETLFEVVPEEAQRVVVSLPVPDRVRELVESRMRRAVTVPPGVDEDDVPRRGTVRARVASGGRAVDALTRLVGELFSDEVHHVMVFTGTEDGAVELADTLTLHGFAAGAPGDGEVPVWVGVDALEARPALDEQPAGSVVVVSADVPADPDTLDRRHGGGRGGWIVIHPEQMPHLRDVAARTGYAVAVPPVPADEPDTSSLARLLRGVEAALGGIDVDAYQVVLAPLYRSHGAERVAAALLGALRARPGVLEALAGSGDAGEAAPSAPSRGSAPAPAGKMVKLFISLGERDGARPGDLVGAITGEARIDGDLIGRIDIRDTFSRVEVDRSVADAVIRALNGTTVRGRAVRVDLDRSERGGGRRTGGGARRRS
jgi:ATP-dependent RNA helicase DeaD